MDLQVSVFLSSVSLSSVHFLPFIISGTIDQLLGASYHIFSVPYFIELALLLRNELQFLSPYGMLWFCLKTAVIILGDNPFKNL